MASSDVFNGFKVQVDGFRVVVAASLQNISAAKPPHELRLKAGMSG